MIRDDLRALIETEQARFEVPGAAVVVVHGDDVLLCEGFGESIVGGAPVTADTHFPIASDTKCFTAAALCIAADEGRLDLDAPVRDVIPWFEMADHHATALVSVRDLLSHRTGLPRHDLVWYGESDLTLEEIVRRLRYLPLSRRIRQTWQYNNLCYSTAGYVTEVLEGRPWHEAVDAVLLKPLGMSHTVFSPHGASITDLARPYKKVDAGFEEQVLPEDTEDRPAGAIVSTVTDLTLWLKARLGQGGLSEAALTALQTPTVAGGLSSGRDKEIQSMGYGLGCQIVSYRGHKVVLHGGNLVGYSSQVMVAPDDGIGVAILTNLHGTALRDTVPLVVLDALLDLEPIEWGERHREFELAGRSGRDDVVGAKAATATTDPPSRPFSDFAGDFHHPAYGTLFITANGASLDVDFHGLGDRVAILHRGGDRFELLFTEFDVPMALVPQLGPDGSITGFTAPLEAMVPPILFTRVIPSLPVELAEALLGEWKMGPVTVTINRRGDGLVATMPGSGPLPLEFAGDQALTSPAMPVLRLTLREDDLLIEPVGAFIR